MGYLNTPEGKETLRKIQGAVAERRQEWDRQAAAIEAKRNAEATVEKLRPYVLQQAEERGKREAQDAINRLYSSGDYMRAMRGKYNPESHTFEGPEVTQ